MKLPSLRPAVLRTLWLIWALGAAGLLLSALRENVIGNRAAQPLNARADWFEGGFQAGAHFHGVEASGLPRSVRTIGSFIGGDPWQGETQTAWARVATSDIAVYVAGYPRRAQLSLAANFRGADGAVVAVPYPLPDAREQWQLWRIRVPDGAQEVQLRAVDRGSGTWDWLAFSEPIGIPSMRLTEIFMAAQVLTTVALVLGLVWFPGLLWRHRFDEDWRPVVLVLTGPLLLVGTALVIWISGPLIRAHHLGFALIAVEWGILGWLLFRRPPALHGAEGAALALCALLAGAAAAKATYSRGPEGELYGGTLSRTLAVGDRSDARISYHVVQVVGHRRAAWDATAEAYFSPWTFFSRGPLAGLAATPVVLATSGRPTVEMPDRAWSPFDATGFAAYRITLIVLASTVFYALFAALRSRVGETWALRGAGLLALTPFAFHDVMFTWPKWEATACLLLAAGLVQARRPFAAGLLVGVGFLYHPLAALWAPWLGLWCVAQAPRSLRQAIVHGARFGAGVLVLTVSWMVAGRLAPHGPEATAAGQMGFIGYFTMADYAPASWASWWTARGANFGNTFIPYWLHAFHPHRVGSVYGEASNLVKFAFAWWNTLPFGMGLLLWAFSAVVMVTSLRRYWREWLLWVVGPALLLLSYWGAHPTGLMRECGHPLLVGIVAVTVLVLAESNARASRWICHPVAPWLQLPELLTAIWLTTLLNPTAPGSDFGRLDALYLAANVTCLLLAAGLLARHCRVAAGMNFDLPRSPGAG